MSNLIKLFWPVVFITIYSFSFEQDTATILKTQLSESPVEKHYNIYLSLAKNETDSLQSDKYVQQAINSAIANNTKEELAKIYTEAAKINFENECYTKALSFCKAAIDAATSLTETNNTIVAEAYNYYGWIYARKHKHKDAIDYFLKAVSYYEKTGSLEKVGDLYNSIGASYWHINNYMKALEFFERALQNGIDYKNIPLQIKAHNNTGIIYENLSQYDKALECQINALELSQQINSPTYRATTYVNIGNIYFYLKQYTEATNNYLKALNIYTITDDESGQSICNNNLGECYLKQDNIDEAIKHYQKALSYATSKRDTTNISLFLLNIGNANRIAGNLRKAYSTLSKALELCNYYSDKGIKAKIYLHLGNTVAAQNKPDQAISYFNNALSITNETKDRKLFLKIYNSLAGFYYKQGDYKSAYLYKDQYSVLNDSVNNNKMLQDMAKMNAIYNTFKDQTTIINLQKENISHSKELMQEKNKRVLFYIVGLSFLTIIIILLTLFLYRRRTANKLKKQNIELNNLNATKDKFFSIIAHDLKSPFNSLLGFSEMLALHAETQNTEQVVEYSNIIHNSTKKLFNLVENLLQWSKAQLGTTKYSPEQTDVYLLANNIISLLRLNAEEKDIVISSKMSRDIVGWVDENLFNTVMRNLLSNAIKFSRVGSMIQVTGVREGDMMRISVADTGVGIRSENLEKLFAIGTNISTKGTFNEQGTGLGLILCKEFVEINKGTIWAESEYGNGSTFHFTVPVYDENKHRTKNDKEKD